MNIYFYDQSLEVKAI